MNPELIDWVVDKFDHPAKEPGWNPVTGVGVAIQYDRHGPDFRRNGKQVFIPINEVTPKLIADMKSELLEWLEESLQ